MTLESPTTLIRDANEFFKAQIEKRDKANTHVLVLYWEDGEEGFKIEASAVASLFQDVFHYQVTGFPIPTSGSKNNLISQIFAILGKNPSLFIIYYGGHSDGNDDRHRNEERRAVWAAHPKGGPTVKWYEIQDMIIETDSDPDILLLLDCCYAGQASRDRSISRFDILAAAAMGVKTPSYGDGSFTTAMIREMRLAIQTDGYVDIKALHSQLTNKRHNLYAQPILTCLKSGPSIQLEPLLPTNPETSSLRSSDNTSILTLFIQIRQDMTQENVDLLKNWLAGNMPPFVSNLALFSKTDIPQTAIDVTANKQGQRYRDVDISAVEKALEPWVLGTGAASDPRAKPKRRVESWNSQETSSNDSTDEETMETYVHL